MEFRYRCKDIWGYCNRDRKATTEVVDVGMETEKTIVHTPECQLDCKSCGHYRNQPVSFSEKLETK